jgi:hypothetical protein
MNRTHDPLDSIYTQPKESLLRRYGGRILAGFACSTFIYFVMHIGIVMTALSWACTIFLAVVGRPPGAERIGKIENKVRTAAPKVEQMLKEHHSDGAIPKIVAPVKAAIEVKKDIDKAKEAIGDIKEGVAEAKDKGVKAIAATGGKVVETVKETPKQVVGGVSDMLHARAEAKEKKDREALEGYAALIGLKTDPSWPLIRLKGEVIKAEAEWTAKHGPNAQCPLCHYGFRLSPKATGERRCPRCNEIFSARRARQLGAPKPAKSIHLFGG